jgi:hypothetical protein
MGPRRTVAAAHAFATRFAKGAAHGQLGSWRRAARRFHWKQRASAFDAQCGQASLAKLEQSKREQEASPQQLIADGAQDASQHVWTTEERLRMVAELLRQVYGVLRHADLLTMSKEEARQLLPTLRLFFRDLLKFYQTEAASLGAEDGGGAGALSADDFMSFMQQMGGLEIAFAELSHMAANTASEESWRPLRDVLAQLYPDESSARRIAAQAHLDSARIHFSARAVDSWHAILTEATHSGLLDGVIHAVQQEYGANTALAKAVQRYRQSRLQENQQGDSQTKKRRVRRQT